MPIDNTLRGISSGNGAEVDGNHNVLVTLPTDPLQAGFTQLAYKRDAAVARANRVTEEGEAYGATSRLLFYSGFNNPPATTPMSAHWGTEATTMAMAASAGFLRLNNAAITTVTTGIVLRSWRTFGIEDGAALRVKVHARHNNGAVANKQFDIGIGYAAPATGQGSAMNEFVGFRWTTAGGFQGVVEYTTGGAPTSLTVSLNGGVPLSDNVSREYELIITDNGVEFWINNVYQASIAYAADAPGILKGAGYPVYIRQFNTGSAPSLAPVLDIGDVAVLKLGFEADVPVAFRQALMGRHCIYNQPGLTATDGQTCVVPASGTAPTATAGSNTAAALTGLGGFFRNTLTGITTTVHTNILCTDYTNPAFPTAAGAANDSRNLILTDIMIPACPVSVALTGGGFVCQWFIAIGSTAVSLATTTANGTTAVATKAPRIMPLPIVDTYAAAAAVGAMPTRSGPSNITFATPLVVHPGEHVAVGFRTLQVTAAVTAGAIDGGISFGGYWD